MLEESKHLLLLITMCNKYKTELVNKYKHCRFKLNTNSKYTHFDPDITYTIDDIEVLNDIVFVIHKEPTNHYSRAISLNDIIILGSTESL